jgi:hypothetical protein
MPLLDRLDPTNASAKPSGNETLTKGGGLSAVFGCIPKAYIRHPAATI